MSAKQAEQPVTVMPAQPPAPVTPMEMLQRAVENGATIETLDKLMGLQERWEKGQARKAFDAAISAAKADIPVVIRNRTGHNNKTYADFAAIARTVDPILGQHGLAYRFRTQQDERIKVTCILSHRDGHYEETTLASPPDTSGNKNAIQAIGSTLTYLQRYTLTQALGLAAADDDDGASVGNGGHITAEQAQWLDTMIEEVGADKAKFLSFLKIENLSELPASMYDAATRALEQKRARK